MAYSSKFTDSVLNKKKKQVEYESKYTKQVLSDTYVPYLDQINNRGERNPAQFCKV